MPTLSETDARYYLMDRDGVKKLSTAFSRTMDTLEKDNYGLSDLSRILKEVHDRDHWDKEFNAFVARWANAFKNVQLVDNPKSLAMNDSGLGCLGQIKKDLCRDIWNDKKMKRESDLAVFETLFWKLVHQKMNYGPLILYFAKSVPRDRVIRMVKMNKIRLKFLKNSLNPTDTEVLEKVVKLMGDKSLTVEIVEDELAIFLEAKGCDNGKLTSLEEYDFRGTEYTNENESSDEIFQDELPVGLVSTDESVTPHYIDVLFEHCLPKLKEEDSALYDIVWNYHIREHLDGETATPEDQGTIELGLKFLNDCVVMKMRENMNNTD